MKERTLRSGKKKSPCEFWKSYKVGSSNLESIRSKLTLHLNLINIFLQSLQGRRLDRIEAGMKQSGARIENDDSASDDVSTYPTVSIFSQLKENPEDVWAIPTREQSRGKVPVARTLPHRSKTIEYVRSNPHDGSLDGRYTEKCDYYLQDAHLRSTQKSLDPRDPWARSWDLDRSYTSAQLGRLPTIGHDRNDWSHAPITYGNQTDGASLPSRRSVYARAELRVYGQDPQPRYLAKKEIIYNAWWH